MKRSPKRSTKGTKPPGLNPHDRFARKTMSDPLIAADLLRHYSDPVVGKYVDLDSLKPEPTQNFGKKFQELFKDIAFASHLIDKKGKAEVLIIAEHKSKPEPFVLLQLLVYLVLSWYNAGTMPEDRNRQNRFDYRCRFWWCCTTARKNGNANLTSKVWYQQCRRNWSRLSRRSRYYLSV